MAIRITVDSQQRCLPTRTCPSHFPASNLIVTLPHARKVQVSRRPATPSSRRGATTKGSCSLCSRMVRPARSARTLMSMSGAVWEHGLERKFWASGRLRLPIHRSRFARLFPRGLPWSRFQGDDSKCCFLSPPSVVFAALIHTGCCGPISESVIHSRARPTRVLSRGVTGARFPISSRKTALASMRPFGVCPALA